MSEAPQISRKVLLLQNLSGLNTPYTFTVEHVAIVVMLGNELTNFPKTYDMRYRSLAPVV